MISDDDQQYTYLPSRPALSQLDQLLTIGSALNLSTLDCSTTHNNIHCRFYREQLRPHLLRPALFVVKFISEILKETYGNPSRV